MVTSCNNWILQNVGLIKYFQVFTTKEPTERELILAIAGMKAWLENEQKEEEK